MAELCFLSLLVLIIILAYLQATGAQDTLAKLLWRKFKGGD